MALKKVYIVEAPDGDTNLVINMFVNRNQNGDQWVVVKDISDADLVQFLGGSDVNPELYGQFKHRLSHVDDERDRREMDIYLHALELGIPMAGICRGGQFLHVMNGGTLYQNVNGHNSSHSVNMFGKMFPITVSSCHHQMMRVSRKTNAMILMYAEESTLKEYMSDLSSGHSHSCSRYITDNYPDPDIESLYYPDTNCLCFQPHPEYSLKQGFHNLYEECQDAYFHFIYNYLIAKEEIEISGVANDDDIPFDDLTLSVSKELENIGCDVH